MQTKRLIAVDLDGTLFGADHQLSPRTIEAVHAVVGQGHAVVVVTGRSAYSAISRLTALPASVRAICSNGAYETDRQTNLKTWSQSLSATAAITIRQQILQHLPSASFGWESDGGLSFEEKFTVEAGGAHTLEQGGSREEFGISDILKLYVRTPELKRGDLQKAVKNVINEQAEASSSNVPFIEVSAPGVNKGSALARVAADLGFAQNQTIAFGDNHNDLPMLRWANESVAMGNAMDDVKLAATTQALSNCEDGVAAMLEQRLNKGEL